MGTTDGAKRLIYINTQLGGDAPAVILVGSEEVTELSHSMTFGFEARDS